MYYLIPSSLNPRLFIYAEGDSTLLNHTSSHALPFSLTYSMRHYTDNRTEIQRMLKSAIISSPDPITPDSHPELFI
jgi:hypothetical protein